jgi:hypothetical protein
MPDTYDDATDAAADRWQQQQLLASLGAWDRALRRDECNAWRINGKHGSIHTWGDRRSWVLFVECETAKQWTWAKKRLAFCEVTQNGDEGGCLRLHTLPTPAQAAVIRDVVGIRKRVEYAPDELARRVERARMVRSQTLMARQACDEGGAEAV